MLCNVADVSRSTSLLNLSKECFNVFLLLIYLFTFGCDREEAWNARLYGPTRAVATTSEAANGFTGRALFLGGHERMLLVVPLYKSKTNRYIYQSSRASEKERKKLSRAIIISWRALNADTCFQNARLSCRLLLADGASFLIVYPGDGLWHYTLTLLTTWRFAKHYLSNLLPQWGPKGGKSGLRLSWFPCKICLQFHRKYSFKYTMSSFFINLATPMEGIPQEILYETS